MGKKSGKSAPHTRRPAGVPTFAGSQAPASPPVGTPLAPGTRRVVDANRLEALLALLGLVLLAGLYIGWQVEPVLRYERTAPAFFVDAPFLTKFLGLPGGPIRGAAAALAQSGFHNWLGAAVFTLVLVGILLCARRLFAVVAGGGATAAAGTLAALVAALPGRYEGHAETTALQVLTALAAGTAWLAGARHGALLRLMLSWTLAGALFWLGGTAPLLLFISTAVVVELAFARRAWPALGHAFSGLIVPVWWWLRPGFQPFAAAAAWGEGLTLVLHASVFLFVPLWPGLHALWAGMRKRRAPQPGARPPAGRGPGPRWAWPLGLTAAVAFWWTCHSASLRTLARFEHWVHRLDWNKALAAAGDMRAWTPGARLHLLRTLSHTRRLPDDLFAYPQRRGLEILPGYEAGLETNSALAETLLELGQVNLAEHLAHEALELEGARPATLRLLARINLVKGRPEGARVFLNRLRLVPFHRAEAEHELRALADDPGGTNRADLAVIRARLPRTDEPDSSLPTEPLLRQLLEANPTNRMACDFLLAHRLLSLQFDELAPDLRRLDAFGETVLPRPCEEALVLYRERFPTNALPSGGRVVSPSTLDRYRRFTEVARRHRGQPAPARAALAPEFGNTLWFYHLFGETAPVSAPAPRPRPS